MYEPLIENTSSLELRKKIPWYVILGYGYGSLAVYVAPMITAFFLNPFLLEVAGIEPAAAGSILLVGNFVDAFSDPIIGYLSDKTPYGPRRIPWIGFATIPFIYFYILLWLVPNWKSYYLVIYYSIIYILRTICLTCITVPYNSLSAELTQSYDERSKLAGSRWIFSLFIGTFCIVIQSFITELFKYDHGPINYEKGYAIAAIVLGLFMGTSSISILLFIKEPPRGSIGNTKSHISLLKGLKLALQNKPFILLSLMFTTSWIALNLLTSNLFLYIKYVIGLEEYYTIILFCLLGVSTICLPIWAYLSKILGKKTVYFIGCTIITALIICLGALPKGINPIIAILAAAIAGIGLAVLYMIPYSMIPDVIEYDQLNTGLRREGTYFSLYVFFEKFGLAITLAISGWILQLSGYISPEEQNNSGDYQSQTVLIVLRILVGVIPPILLILSMIFIYFYPISKKYHTEIVEKLNNKTEFEKN